MSLFRMSSITGLSLTCIVLSIIVNPPSCSSTFLVGDSRMPFADAKMAIGYDETNDTILLLGGFQFRQHFALFKNNNFIDQDKQFFNDSIYGDGQFYTQLGNILWMISSDNTGFRTFDTRTYQMKSPSSPSIEIQTPVDDSACLTSTDDYLIVIGGGGAKYPYLYLDTVQIYHLAANQWLSNVSTLNAGRIHSACVVGNNKLYSIGGYGNDDDSLDSIEVLDVSNMSAISSTSWNYLGCTLQKARDSLRVALYGTDMIYVVGGETLFRAWPSVDIINTVTDECLVADDLNFDVTGAPPIIVQNTLFVFGGATTLTSGDNFIVEDRYQYLPLPTFNPTSYPTVPTSSSLYPSKQPTKDPSVTPTKSPIQSTVAPTMNPINPTVSPFSPTNNPVQVATMIPTDSPSNPTNAPVFKPFITTNPTNHPITLLPTISPVDSPLEASLAPTIKTGNAEVEEFTSTLDDSDASSEERQEMDTTMNTTLTMMTVVSGAICMCCMCLLGMYYWWHRYTKNVKNMRHEMEQTEAQQATKEVEPQHREPQVKMEQTNGATDMMVGEDMIGVEFVAPCDSDHDHDEEDDDTSNEILDVVNQTIGGMHLQEDDDDEGDIDDEDFDNEIVEVVNKTIGANDLENDGNGDVKRWLESIGCGQYADLFTNNGFSSMDFVKEIKDGKDLEDIGITSRVHQLKILNHAGML
eukprot:1168414_1